MTAKGYPHKQEFNIKDKHHNTKKVNSWWNPKSRTYWRGKANDE